jgi:quercetin dioxygenase-like cupin family protein
MTEPVSAGLPTGRSTQQSEVGATPPAAVAPPAGAAAAGEANPPAPGALVWLGGLGVRFLLGGEQTGGRFSLVEHPLRPRALGSPVHTHRDEDEYSYVLEGRVGVQIGDEVSVAGPGALIVKPRGVPHAFWNAGDAPARLLEVISPAGFEAYFAALAPLLPPGTAQPDGAAIAAVRDRYHLEADPASVPQLTERHGLLPY